MKRGSFPLTPLWERVARIVRCETGEGVMSLVVWRPLIRRFAPPSHKGRREGKKRSAPPYVFTRIASGVSGCASGWAFANAGSAIAVSKMRFTVG
ncbi:MAG: hypothetical protein JWQ89_4501 [Devosia sp.]|nr:hypothetical protein [Devosia sp.]